MLPVLISLLAGLVCASAPQAEEELVVLDGAALQAVLVELGASALVEVSGLGRSRGGRAIQTLKLSSAVGDETARPAILVVAGLDGPHAYTTSMAVSFLRQLVAGYGRDERITSFLDSTTVYCLPRLDVDGAAARFAQPLAEVMGTGRGIDNDRDGLRGEDPPADVNGDGWVTRMRVVDSEGEWIIDPADPRAMKKADRAAGEVGRFKNYGEGYDRDGDERVAEDAPLDAVVNRNFPRNWTENDGAAGRYPTDEPGVLAMCDFILAHTDIALVLAYGDEGNLVGKPETQKDAGPSERGSVVTGIFEEDAKVYAELGKRYRKITDNKSEGLGEQPGSLQGWLYHHRGLFTLNISPWAVPLDAKAKTEEGGDEDEQGALLKNSKTSAEQDDAESQDDSPEASDDSKRLLWLDQNGIEAHVPWTRFDHPELGEVEIGGFKPYALVEPGPARLAKITAVHFEHLLSLAELLPRPSLNLIEFQDLDSGLFEVSVALSNRALLPLFSRAGERSRTGSPVQVHLDLPQGAELIAGSLRTLVHGLEGAGGRKELRWLIRFSGAGSGAQIRLESKHAGRTKVALEVN
jgi:hypothetical protein